jgi:hypothetical protein
MGERDKKYDRFDGAIILHNLGRTDVTSEQEAVMRRYSDERREAIFENGDVVKYVTDERNNLVPEWIFSPMLGWNRLPIEVINLINDCNCMRDYYGNVILDEMYADPKVGWVDQFFIMKSTGEWKFRIAPYMLIYEGFWRAFTPSKPRKRFTLFGGMKIYKAEDLKYCWINEDVFTKRLSTRQALTQEKLLEKFNMKYETIFKWLLGGYNKREQFWENIKRDAAKGVLDCYEIRLEEIVNQFTDVTKKYWKNQRGIAARGQRTKLFKSDIFKHRRSDKSYGFETFGTGVGSYCKKVLYSVRTQIMH